MQLDIAKTHLLFHLARAFTFNGIAMAPMNSALVLSLLPNEYHRYLQFDFRNSTSIVDSLSFVVEKFTDLFFLNLDPKKETLITKNQNFTRAILKRDYLSKIEYLILFQIFLNLHQLIVRVNFIIDISDMEDSKQIKVKRQKANDHYVYGRGRFAN
jgi:hypothetical protein